MNEEINQLLLESVNLLLVGMVVVFVFLTVLIGVVKLMSAFVQKFPDPSPEVSNKKMLTPQPEENVSPEVVAAISSAIHQYRQK